MIEQVDVNTLKVVATFPSQSEAERQTGIPRPRTKVRRDLRQGPFGYLHSSKASIILQVDHLVRYTFVHV
jgi:hypothetical protein